MTGFSRILHVTVEQLKAAWKRATINHRHAQEIASIETFLSKGVHCNERKTPPGWFCSRDLRHEGPCAAWYIGTLDEWTGNAVTLTKQEAWRLAKLLEGYTVGPELQSVIDKLKVAQPRDNYPPPPSGPLSEPFRKGG